MSDGEVAARVYFDGYMESLKRIKELEQALHRCAIHADTWGKQIKECDGLAFVIIEEVRKATAWVPRVLP